MTTYEKRLQLAPIIGFPVVMLRASHEMDRVFHNHLMRELNRRGLSRLRSETFDQPKPYDALVEAAYDALCGEGE